MQASDRASPEALKAFEAVCESAARAVRQAGSMRDAMQASEVTEPHTLQGVGRLLPGYRRLHKALANRLEELLMSQLEVAGRIREPYGLDKELDQLKVREWYVLRTDYPELYTKGVAQAAQLIRRMQQTRKR
jgi:nitrate/nitrite-specific signal transduction histidine kinase